MNFLIPQKIVRIKLKRDLSKHIKRGHPWIFSDAIDKKNASDGSYAILTGHKDEILGHGIYSPQINLSFRIVTLGDQKITSDIIKKRLDRAIFNKKHLLTSENKCFRVINGEGDELPGIVADYYDSVIVLKLDGISCENFWNKSELANYFIKQQLIPVKCVYYKRKNKEEDKGQILLGDHNDLSKVQFKEHGVNFETNIIDAAKTGFFLDQRENRNFIRSVAQSKTLLNLFGYTGGFSVYAGLGGAHQVTTVDIAPHAIKASEKNWELNYLPIEKHQAICADAFEWVKQAIEEKKLWDIVITDPPSFAPNQKAIASAKEAYVKIFSDSIKLVRDEGFFAASSCSGHIGFEEFLDIVQEALSKSKRRGKIMLIKGQPEDHPFPIALTEMRYLKFVYLQIFK